MSTEDRPQDDALDGPTSAGGGPGPGGPGRGPPSREHSREHARERLTRGEAGAARPGPRSPSPQPGGPGGSPRAPGAPRSPQGRSPRTSRRKLLPTSLSSPSAAGEERGKGGGGGEKKLKSLKNLGQRVTRSFKNLLSWQPREAPAGAEGRPGGPWQPRPELLVQVPEGEGDEPGLDSASKFERRASRRLKEFQEKGESWRSLRLHGRMLSSPNLAALDFTELVKPEARHKNFRPFRDEYELQETIGTGGYAVVRKAVHRRTGEQCAVKIMRVSDEDAADDEMTHVEILNELKLMQQLDHPNIVHMKEYFINAGICYVVMEILQGQDLMDHLIDLGKHTEEDAKVVMRRLLDAIAYMHGHNVSHRDLKLENIVLRESGDLGTVTIVDFGLAKAARAREHMEDLCGTPEYAAPEILLEKPYTPQVDCWSLGVGLHVLLTGQFPFEHEDEEELYEIIVFNEVDYTAPQWEAVSEEAQDLLKGLLTKDPKERLSAAAALEHSWFTGLKSHTASVLHHVHTRLEKLVESTKMPTRTFNKGDWLVLQGERGHEVYMIQEGECEVIVRKDGVESQVAVLRPGNFAGEVDFDVAAERRQDQSALAALVRERSSTDPRTRPAPYRRSQSEVVRRPMPGADGSKGGEDKKKPAGGGLSAFIQALKEVNIVKSARMEQKRTASVRALTKVKAVVLSTEDMDWAAEHDYRLDTSLHQAMRQRRKQVRQQMKAQARAEYEAQKAERAAGGGG